MKRILLFTSFFCVFNTYAQVKIKTGTTISATIPTTDPDQLRVENGLIAHRVSGTVGAFGATDKWIGIGQPLSTLYGLRIQWNQQLFAYALRQNSGTTVRNAIIEWGNQGGEMQLRYVTNPSDPTNGFIKIINLTSAGNAYVGAQNSGNFTNPKFEVNTSSQLALASNTTGLLGNSFINRSTNTDLFTVAPTLRIQSTANVANSGRTDGISIVSGGARDNYGLVSNVTGGSNYNVGVLGQSNSAGVSGIGVNAVSNAAASSNYGLLASATGGANSYGIYASASGASTANYAGYFSGNVFTTGVYQSSDTKLKKDVKEESNTIPKLKLLRPVSYNYKQDEFPELNLPKQFQHGLIAQEVEKAFPELVSEVENLKIGDNGQPVSKGKIKAVNYTMLIPLLIKSLQEQQDYIELLEKRMNDMEFSLGKNALSTSSENSLVLSQNTPNPFDRTTVIKYSIPQKFKNATLSIFDMTGKLLMKYDNLNNQGQITIDAGKLSSGIYLYGLYNRNEEIVTKRMVISK